MRCGYPSQQQVANNILAASTRKYSTAQDDYDNMEHVKYIFEGGNALSDNTIASVSFFLAPRLNSNLRKKYPPDCAKSNKLDETTQRNLIYVFNLLQCYPICESNFPREESGDYVFSMTSS